MCELTLVRAALALPANTPHTLTVDPQQRGLAQRRHPARKGGDHPLKIACLLGLHRARCWRAWGVRAMLIAWRCGGEGRHRGRQLGGIWVSLPARAREHGPTAWPSRSPLAQPPIARVCVCVTLARAGLKGGAQEAQCLHSASPEHRRLAAAPTQQQHHPHLQQQQQQQQALALPTAMGGVAGAAAGAAVRHVPAKALHVSRPTWWLESRFHFSFADWWDPARSNFGALRVVNDDLVKPRSGFGAHPHRDAEVRGAPPCCLGIAAAATCTPASLTTTLPPPPPLSHHRRSSRTSWPAS